MKKEDERKTLYRYLSSSYIKILLIVLISTVCYFAFINKIIGGELRVNKIINSDIINDEVIREQVEEGLRNAIIYSLIIGIALIWVVVNHIIKPVRKITEATKKVASGDLNVKVEINNRDEIGALAENFNLMVKELNSIEYLRKDFISNVSHELKTPIASIQGFTKLLADDSLSKEEKQEYINIILEETTRLSSLSTNMLKLSKLENQKMITNRNKYRLDNQIRKAIIMFGEEVDKKNIKISLKSKEIIVNQDEDLIMEIWINILNNAVKYTNENGKIDIEVIEEDKYVKVKIKDNGIGIPEREKERIYEKFYQVEKSHSSDGTGLGLAIVKRIIEMINGEISFKSEEGKGTTFEISLEKYL